jgi:N-acylneuraminate cytidylyltransferase/CMP-N,N'-diacetyllegionaminic acid synthase
MMLNNDTDVVITGYEPERNPYFNMMEITDGKYATMVKKTERPIVRRQDAPKVYSLTPAVYVMKKEALYQYKHWSEARCMIYEIPRENAVDIDTEFDLKLVEFLMKNNNING